MDKNNDMEIPRILIVDDEKSVHDAISQVLVPDEAISSSRSGMKNLAAKLFKSRAESLEIRGERYDLVSCFQGEDGVAAVAGAIADNRHFTMVFLDMRMPPGKDGLWTAEQIRELDPMINILIMTAYSDIDPIEISKRVQPVDKLLYVQKPLRPQEIRQFAASLSTKWLSENEPVESNMNLALARNRLEEMLEKRTEVLENTEGRLVQKTIDLDESNIAMKVLLKNVAVHPQDMEKKIKEMDEKVLINVKELTEPYLEKLEKSDLDQEQRECIEILRLNLEKVTSPIMQRLYSDEYNFTPSELQVANLIRQGKRTKDIASLLNLSTRTVEFHRDNIRKKLGIKDRKTNLRSVLQAL